MVTSGACGPTSNQLVSLLQPFAGRFPNPEQEYNALELSLRRMGHILEGASQNIGTSIGGPTNAYPAFPASSSSDGGNASSSAGDPWWSSGDPWAASAGSSQPLPAQTPQGNPWEGYAPTFAAAPATPFQGPEDDFTDTETSSMEGEEADYSECAGMTPEQTEEHMFRMYARAKSNWRKHSGRPTRRVRTFLKRKGKGKGKGATLFQFLNVLGHIEYDSLFYGGKGKSKGARRTAGKGKGRRLNPFGRDGTRLKCSFRLSNGQVCNSEEHLRADCPQSDTRSDRAAKFRWIRRRRATVRLAQSQRSCSRQFPNVRRRTCGT